MQIYEENNRLTENAGIDLLAIADDMWKAFRKYWLRFVILVLAVMSLYTARELYIYKPNYEAYVTFVISKNQSSAVDTVVTNRLSNSFQYVLRSGRLESYIRKELGIVGGAAMPVSLASSAIEDTNLLTITAYSQNETQADKAIEAVITYYPDLATQVVGDVDMTAIDRSGISGEPQNPLNIVVTVVKGAGFGIAVVLVILFLMAYNNSTIGRYEDLKKYLNMPCLGTIPLTKFKKRKQKFDATISIHNDKVPGSFRDAVNTLRTRVEKDMREKDLKTLLVSSSVPGEGKTTVSLNLALSLQSRGKKVLLIDGDLRNPSMNQIVGVKDVKRGIADILRGKATVGECITHHKGFKMDMIFGRKAVSNASELLSSRRMQELIDEVVDYYDYVIVDTPPAAMMTDASVVAAYMDALLYVIRQDFAKVSHISEGLALLTDSDIEILGCVLNFAQPGLGRYGYGKYGYGKYGKYGYGYE